MEVHRFQNLFFTSLSLSPNYFFNIYIQQQQKYNLNFVLGYFVQHPQSEKVWFEVDMQNDNVYAWQQVDVQNVAETGSKIFKFEDVSMPKRKDKAVRIVGYYYY